MFESSKLRVSSIFSTGSVGHFKPPLCISSSSAGAVRVVPDRLGGATWLISVHTGRISWWIGEWYEAQPVV